MPLYHQLKQILQAQMQSGELRAGDALPTEKDLEAKYGVSRVTVRRALSDMATAGLITRKSGRGSFVLPYRVQDASGKLGGLFEDLAEQGFAATSEILECEWKSVPWHIADLLTWDQHELALFFKRLISAGGVPISLASGYFRLGQEFVCSPAELVTESIFSVVERKLGVRWPSADKTLEAVAVSGADARILKIRAGSPVLLSKVTVHDELGRKVAYFEALYRSDRYKFRCTLHR